LDLMTMATSLLTVNGLWTQFIEPLRKRETFRTHGSLRGEPAPYGPGTFGRLPAMFRDSASHADYVIYSYATPIAWHGPDGWVMPPVTYSVTTSKQQGRIATALSALGALS
jgi:hypothetical protein